MQQKLFNEITLNTTQKKWPVIGKWQYFTHKGQFVFAIGFIFKPYTINDVVNTIEVKLNKMK